MQYMHTKSAPAPGLLWPFPWVLSNQATAGATWPSQKEKVAIFDVSIKLLCQQGGVVGPMLFSVNTEKQGLLSPLL